MKKISLSLLAMSMLVSAHDTISPTFTSASQINVFENQVSALTLKATDPATKLYRWEKWNYSYYSPLHAANTSVYSISSADASSFNINSITGEVSFKKAPDFESKSLYTFTATATDAQGNSTRQDVRISILDVAETTVDTVAPVFTSNTRVSVKENQSNAITLIATDENKVSYSISSADALSFNLNAQTGVVSFKQAPDFEVKSSYSFIAKARDEVGNATSQNIFITILDENEVAQDIQAPIFTTSSSITTPENQTFIAKIQANDETSNVTYFIVSGDSTFFQINTNTGDLSFKLAPDYEKRQNYLVGISAKDAAGNVTVQDFSIEVTNIINEEVIPEGALSHNGFYYLRIDSPFTNRTWLDRNLGASTECKSIDDKECYGDLYQWGRQSDGHQLRSSISTEVLETSLINTSQYFIFPVALAVDLDIGDWMQEIVDKEGQGRKETWNALDGTSVCPIGFRVPTFNELAAETINAEIPIINLASAYESFLKLPQAGGRLNRDDEYFYPTPSAQLWTNNPQYEDGARYLSFYEASVSGQQNYVARSYGKSIRCIQDAITQK